MPLVERKPLEDHLLTLRPRLDVECDSPFLQLCYIERGEPEVLVLTSFVRLEEFNFNLPLELLVRKLRREYRYKIPVKCAAQTLLNLALVDGLVDPWAYVLVNHEKVHAAGIVEAAPQRKAHLFVMLTALLVCGDLDGAALPEGAVTALQRSDERLVASGDDLMKAELNRADEIVASVVFKIREVVDVVDNSLEELAFLEVVLYLEGRDPLRLQRVHDHLGTADFLPQVALLVVENEHSVSAGERVQVWQVGAREAQAYKADEALVLLDRLVCGRQHRRV